VTEDGAKASVAAPVIINGRISKAGEVDTFTFKPPSAGPIVLEIAAARFGSRLDALLTLADENGNTLQRNDDAAGADARITFTAEKDKTYRAIVRDLTDHGGDAYGYRLSIVPPRADRPDFDVALRSGPEVRLNRGGRTMLRADVTRKGGFKSDVTVALFPLPPGVTCKPLVVPATQPSSGVFTLSAAADAPTGFHPLSIVATAAVGDEVVTKTAAANPVLGTTPQVYLSIHEAAPIQIARVGPPTDADKDGRAAKIAALEKTLSTTTPQLAEAQAKWEKTFDASKAWEIVEVVQANSSASIPLEKQPDGSIRPNGRVPSVDKYTVVARVASANVRAIRLEAIAEGMTGPGRAPNGNFVLSTFAVAALPAKSTDAGAGTPLDIASATASFNQDGFSVSDSIPPGRKDGGWAIAPDLGKSQHAVYRLKSPALPEGNANLAFVLDHASPHAQHVLGRFRLLVTSAEKPDDALKVPSALLSVLKTPADKRSKEQQDALATFYRSISPELAKTRGELAALKSSGATFPPTVTAGGQAKLDVLITRSPDFTGDVTLTLDGFSTGTDDKPGQAGQPAPFSKNFDFTPVTLKPNQASAVLDLKAKPTAEKGTRDAILRAETTINGARYTIYSQTFPITVK
jgi:hypothetical protein